MCPATIAVSIQAPQRDTSPPLAQNMLLKDLVESVAPPQPSPPPHPHTHTHTTHGTQHVRHGMACCSDAERVKEVFFTVERGGVEGRGKRGGRGLREQKGNRAHHITCRAYSRRVQHTHLGSVLLWNPFCDGCICAALGGGHPGKQRHVASRSSSHTCAGGGGGQA
jgi:hypothetical protein